MMITGTVSAVEGNNFRICVNGIVSMPITRLEHVINIKIGDKVLCNFDNAVLSSGIIIGKVVG